MIENKIKKFEGSNGQMEKIVFDGRESVLSTIFRYKYHQHTLQQTRLDITDLRIMKLLSRDSRTTYRNIASTVGKLQNY